MKMGQFERSIKIAFDESTGEIIDAGEKFDDKKDGFITRRQFLEKKKRLTCCECEQELNISGSKYDRLHFKHKPQHGFCILTDGDLSPKEHQGFTEILKRKESERHKVLKNKLGQLLSKVSGVDVSSISIDAKFIIKDNGKRRPDVYCKYFDKEFVFEIQLSDLSLGYILSRYEFYKQNGMYLIWILDNFDIHRQGTLERDIKYLTKYQNFFKLDEEENNFKLVCDYKFPFLTDDNRFLTKWLRKSVHLNQLSYDSEDYQVYFYNFGDNKILVEENQKRKAEEIVESERKRIEEEKTINAKRKSNDIIQKIKELRIRKAQNFNSIVKRINELNCFELKILNSILDLCNQNPKKKPALHQWINSAKQDDIAFIEFILNCNVIDMDVNMSDSEGTTTFQAIYKNDQIHKYIPIKALMKRGYKITEEDEIAFKSKTDFKYDLEYDWLIYLFCNRLSNRDLVDDVFTHDKLLFIIESAKRKEIIGYNYKPNEFVAFANNAIHSYSFYWEYIELAFKRFGLWDIIIQADRKGTFQKKVIEFYTNMPIQKFDFDEIFNDLYPELNK